MGAVRHTLLATLCAAGAAAGDVGDEAVGDEAWATASMALLGVLLLLMLVRACGLLVALDCRCELVNELGIAGDDNRGRDVAGADAQGACSAARTRHGPR